MSYCPNCKCWTCRKIREERREKRLATEKTLKQLWQEYEPVGNYRDGSFPWATIYEVRRGPKGGYIGRDGSYYRRIASYDIDGYHGKRLNGDEYYTPPRYKLVMEAGDRRRRLRDLHPDKLGREQTPAEREEFTRLAGGGAR